MWSSVDAAAKLAGQAEMLANRVAKNARHLARWAKREGVGCYRVYDCDIPELPLTIDRYDTSRGPHAAVWLWEGSGPPRAREWVAAMCEAIAATLVIPMADLHLKVRARQEGKAQYERLAESGERLTVREDGIAFLVNLEDYLDTGLFLDHRALRRRVRLEARGRDVLNLFAYTGAFSVHAAVGGARSTTTIDMSATYLDWARDNFVANGLAPGKLVRADVLQWLVDANAAGVRDWDLVVLDPPTFSNSKKMRATLDVQRDHPELIGRSLALMRPGGVLYFSTNARKFRPDEETFRGAEEITRATLPPDFRDDKIHRAWRLTR